MYKDNRPPPDAWAERRANHQRSSLAGLDPFYIAELASQVKLANPKKCVRALRHASRWGRA